MKGLKTKIVAVGCALFMAVCMIPVASVHAEAMVCPNDGGKLVPHAAKAATCDAYGNHAFWSCDKCNKCYFDLNGAYEIYDLSWVAIAPTGHNVVVTPEVAATCMTNGATSSVCCSACNKIFSSAQLVPAFGHQYAVTNIKTAHAKGDGKITETCSICGGQKVTVIKKPASVELSRTSYTYDGSAKKPKVTVYDSEDNIIPTSEYTVSYSNNKKAGTAKVTVKFKGNHYYSGKMTTTFKITK